MEILEEKLEVSQLSPLCKAVAQFPSANVVLLKGVFAPRFRFACCSRRQQRAACFCFGGKEKLVYKWKNGHFET